ncbi:hypothetical protein PV10_00524 [Exophiala mesophila]|uniref:Membrane anchor Opy2 N-terminal domain-containing protein n=1 Tax=Exophiala mesophila TaxID=212818 RepID=A0A0D1Y7I5_EXOME|nr:uncharacterized protein PV10_00524 [Exophiala mesophila]KIV96691.1 hypothetical protein PV10_00524 [Exophiala mesophila]
MVSSSSYIEAFNHPLFRRCVQCPPESPPCPSCAADETCSLKAASCDSCASTTCVKLGSIPGQTAPKSETPVGGIVGGVIGGLAFIAILYLIYHFCVKRKRSKVEIWDPPEKRDQSTLHRSARHSTAHSIASTVLTRASNVIQIAYIPGVTVRSPPQSPGLVPPVPSMPGGGSTAGTPGPEQHFFMPGDLRDSTWSDSSFDPRISISPSLYRDSVATTIYRSDAIVPPIPAQHAFRGQANVVSVKSGAPTPASGNTPNTRTPQIPSTPNFGQNGSSIIARNVTARPIEVKKANPGTKVPTLANLAKENSRRSSPLSPSSTEPDKSPAAFSDEKEVLVSSSATTPISEAAQSPLSPIAIPRPAFAGNVARSSGVSSMSPAGSQSESGPPGPTHRHTSSRNAALNAMIEDAINRAKDPQHIGATASGSRPELAKHDSGPFSDANEVKENVL